MRRRVRRGSLQAPFWRSRHGAIAKAALVLAAGWTLMGGGRRDERGSVAPMVGILGTALIGFAALAVDVSVWEGNVGTMQGAADQAALAAGMAMSAGIPAAQNEAKGVAAAHGFVDDSTKGVTVTPTVNTTTKAITVVITQLQTTFLSGVKLPSPPTASVKAVAVPSSDPACLVVLAAKGYGITSSGSTNLNASNCNVYINSDSTCDVSMSGTGKVTGVDAYLGAPSQGCNSGGAGVYATSPGTVHYGASATDDPYGSPTPSPPSPCKAPNINKPLDPGTYCGLTLSGSQSLTLTGGVYIFTGGINLSGTSQITGSGGATLVFTGSGNSGITSSGYTTIRLDAPATGTTAGIALWFDKAVPRSVNASGTLNLNINGAFYAPGSNVQWSGIASSNECMQLIASTLALSGSGTLNFGHTNCSNYGVKDVGGSSGYKLVE